MDLSRVRRKEHFAFFSRLDLEPLCAEIRAVFDLPPFQFGSEDATEWGWCDVGGLEYNVSMPYEDGTLQEWDETVPPDCNVGLTISIAKEHPHVDDPAWVLGTLVPRIGERLAAALRAPLIHHRTWLGPGQNEHRGRLFIPPSGDSPV